MAVQGRLHWGNLTLAPHSASQEDTRSMNVASCCNRSALNARSTMSLDGPLSPVYMRALCL
jgi:hypothetical protein